MIEKILCLGNNTEDTDRRVSVLAQHTGGTNHGLVSDSEFVPDRAGYYHTTLADLTSGDVVYLAQRFDKIVQLAQPVEQWTHPYLFTATCALMKKLHEEGMTVEYEDESTVSHFHFFEDLLATNKSFCMYPFMHLHELNGSTTLCTRSSVPVSKIRNIRDWATDVNYVEIRQKMLKGEPLPEHCSYCYKVEANGAKGVRYHDSMKWISELNIKSLDDLQHITAPAYVEVRSSNKCNIMCRTCTPRFSDLLDKEFNKIGVNVIEINQPWQQYNSFDMVDLDQIKMLYITGGEPTVIPQVTEFLTKCVTQGRTDFEIMINTNAAKVSTKLLKLFSNFSKLGFSASIDSVGPVNDYIRYPAKFESIVSNCKTLRDQGHHLAFISVASLYSVEHLGDLFEFFDREFANSPIQLQYAYNVDHYQSPYWHPDWQRCVDSLEKCKTTKTYYNYSRGTKDIVDVLLEHYKSKPTPNIEQLKLFFDFNDKVDRSRKMYLRDYIPNLDQARHLLK